MQIAVGNLGEGLTAAQRAEIFRRQMLIERDRLEAMHASLHVIPPEDHEDIEKALSLRLGASEMAAKDAVMQGRVEDFLVARIDPNNDDEDIVVLAWSDLAASMQLEGADEAAVARLAETGLAHSALREAMARKVVNEARIVAIGEFREVLVNPGSPYAAVPLQEYEAAPLASAVYPQVVASQLITAPASAATGPWATMTPTEAVEKFFHHNPRTGGTDGKASRRGGQPWTEKTREQFRLPALLLEQVMHGRPLATITHDDLVNLDSCFARLHGPSFRKSPKHRDMTIWEIVAETEERIERARKAAEQADKHSGKAGEPSDLPAEILPLGLGLSTTNRHWGFLRQLTNWFAKHHPLSPLDFSAFVVKIEGNARDEREAYTEEQGRQLFSLPPWSGSKSHSRRMQPGKLIVHGAWYFVPLIGWYTGMRREEICGLRLDDIKLDDGYWHFDIRPTDIRRLKTVTSKRKLPFADELVRLGLPEYVTALREAGETMLFPELVAESGKGSMGDAYYKNIWTKIAGGLPFLKTGQATHSFRHTLINDMKGNGITPEIRADFAGHKLSNETQGRYSKAHMKLLREAAKAITNVTAHLDPVPITLLPERLRAPRKARVKKDKSE